MGSSTKEVPRPAYSLAVVAAPLIEDEETSIKGSYKESTEFTFR